MVGQQHTAQEGGGTGATAHAEGDFVVDAQLERQGGAAGVAEHVAEGLEDHVVGGAGAAICVAAGSLDAEGRAAGTLRHFGIDGQIEGHCQAGGVESGAEVGGGGGQA